MKKLEDVVRSMTAKQIIMAMVEGLRNPVTMINMGTYGSLVGENCFGCAATNAICKIQGIEDAKTLKFSTRQSLSGRERIYNSDGLFLSEFEMSIDILRQGQLWYYNGIAKKIGIATIVDVPGILLPWLKNDYSENELQKYVELADSQPE